MATTIDRTNFNLLVDDSGSGTDGTILNKAQIAAVILDQVDALIAAAIVFGSTISERGRTTPMGEWINVTFSAGNFTGNGSMTWTLASGDQVTFKYTLIGKTMIVSVVLQTTTVGGTPNTDLRIAIPGGFTAAVAMVSPCDIVDNGTFPTTSARGRMSVAAGATQIVINTATGGNWTASTDQTHVRGQIAFEVS
jgi:hypothetical protein